MKVLVTGGAGFIGSHLCDALIKKGYHVSALDNLVTGSEKNIDHLKGNPRFTFIKHDILKDLPAKIKANLQNLKYIYHLASPASPPKYRKYAIETILVNSIGTKKMLDLAKSTQAKFLFTSTSEVYGNPLEHPQKEKYFGNVNPVGPRACYDESKRLGESITMEYVRIYGLDARIVRIFNTYGPRMDPLDGRVIVNFINQVISGNPVTIYGDGTQTRSFCYILDMVKGIISAMEKEKTKGLVVNLGYPKEYTVKEIAMKIIELFNKKTKITYSDLPVDDPVRRRPDISLAKDILGWQPEVNLQDGLSETIKYFSKK